MKRLLLLVLLGMLAATQAAAETHPLQGSRIGDYAQEEDSTIAYPGRSRDPAQMLRVHGACAFIDNASSKSYFVPLRSQEDLGPAG